MADTFLNSPASHENNLSYHNMLHFIIGQNEEYLKKICSYWSSIELITIHKDNVYHTYTASI